MKPFTCEHCNHCLLYENSMAHRGLYRVYERQRLELVYRAVSRYDPPQEVGREIIESVAHPYLGDLHSFFARSISTLAAARAARACAGILRICVDVRVRARTTGVSPMPALRCRASALRASALRASPSALPNARFIVSSGGKVGSSYL